MASKRIYISGPMTGMPEHNFPAFHAAADRLRKAGWSVVNPAVVAALGSLALAQGQQPPQVRTGQAPPPAAQESVGRLPIGRRLTICPTNAWRVTDEFVMYYEEDGSS